jgi:FkbM family methyltransferase
METPGAAPWWIAPTAGFIQRLPFGRYRALNWIGQRAAEPFWARMPADFGSLWFRCHLRDRIMREVCLTGRYEPQETALLQELLGPGMVFADVGANWGYFTLAAAHIVGRTGRVISVEADPRACGALRDNVARNYLRSVSVFEAAASDVQGLVRMREYELAADDAGSFGLAESTTTVAHGREFEVAARPLDTVLDEAGVDRVDLLKMDIEGAEGRALAGLERSLASRRIARILIELHPQHLADQGSSAAEVIATLRRHGYHGWTIDQSPSIYRRVAAGQLDVTSALSPLEDRQDLGPWPHLLWT